jgi:hypothetical protein
MRITRNADREAVIMTALRTSFTETRTGVHLSDLLSPRQAAFRRTMPMPLTASEVLYFLAGRGHEEVFARLAGVEVGASKVQVVRIPGFIAGEGRLKHGISYRPDFRWDTKPTEFKTRRSNLAEPGQESRVYDHYLEQLLGYCCLDEVPYGHLIVFSLLEGRSNDPLNPTHPEIAVYDVQFSPGEMQRMEAELQKRALGYLPALIDLRLVQNLPLCAAWLCGKPRKKITRAAWCIECRSELSEPWASKHSSTKKGEGHTVTPELVEWEYEPRCPYYPICEPQKTDPSRGPR